MRVGRWFVAAGLAALVAAVGLQTQVVRAVPPAQASQPVAYAQYCSQTMPGTVQVVVLWTPSYQGQQWLDLSLLNNGFVPGTFVSVGPLPHDRWGFGWDGLQSGLTHYIRVNTLTPNGWLSSATTSFVTGVCPPPVATVGTPTQECSSQHPDRVKVTFNWTPGASAGTKQYVDLSIFNNGFAPGTFISAGPLAADAGSHAWDGLGPNTGHYWRVNTLSGAGWHPSGTGSFTTINCVGVQPPPPTPTPEPEGTRYYNRAQGFSIVFPDEWMTMEDVEGIAVFALSPLESLDDRFLEYVFVAVDELGAGVDSDDYFQAYVATMNAVLDGFREHERGEATIDGEDAKWVVYSYNMGGLRLKTLAYTVVKGHRGYVIDCNAQFVKLPDYRSTFERIAQSFRFE